MATKYNPFYNYLELITGNPTISSDRQYGAYNLGIAYSGGTLSLVSADGTGLSEGNPGYVVVASKSDPGELVTYTITSGQSFEDATGTSVIVGNLFGLTGSVAETNNVPFFLYACTDDSQSNIVIGISRIPHHNVVPVSTEIGTPSNPIADEQESMFLFESVTVTDYDQNPCLLVGSFKMTKDSSDDWTVTTLDLYDGIGSFQEGQTFTYSTGQFGNTTGKYFDNNGGVAPVYSTNEVSYQIKRNGLISIKYNFQTLTTSPSSSNNVILYPPFIAQSGYTCGCAFTGSSFYSGLASAFDNLNYISFLQYDLSNDAFLDLDEIDGYGLSFNSYYIIGKGAID